MFIVAPRGNTPESPRQSNPRPNHSTYSMVGAIVASGSSSTARLPFAGFGSAAWDLSPWSGFPPASGPASPARRLEACERRAGGVTVGLATGGRAAVASSRADVGAGLAGAGRAGAGFGVGGP